MEYRELIKESSRLKKEKNILEAIKVLKYALEIRDKTTDLYSIDDDLKLCMYLAEAGYIDESKNNFRMLLQSHPYHFDQVTIYNQLAIFHKKNNDVEQALFYRAFGYVLTAVNKVEMVKEMESRADEESSKEINIWLTTNRKEIFYNQNGNIIGDVSYPFLLEDIRNLKEKSTIKSFIQTYIKRSNLSCQEDRLILIIEQSINERIFSEDLFRMRYCFLQA